MRNIFILAFISLICFSAVTKTEWPDLTKKEDLKALGTGKIIEKDKSIITRIVLEELNENAIVYIKDESLHDIAIDQVARIEFKGTKWGPLQIVFPQNRAKVIRLEE